MLTGRIGNFLGGLVKQEIAAKAERQSAVAVATPGSTAVRVFGADEFNKKIDAITKLGVTSDRATIAAQLDKIALGKETKDRNMVTSGVRGLHELLGDAGKDGGDGQAVIGTQADHLISRRRGMVPALKAPAEMLDGIGQPASTLRGGITDPRPYEWPYHQPTEQVTVQPGAALDVSKLDKNRHYLWVVDTEGTVIVAPEKQNGFRASSKDRVKHRDLVPPASKGRRPGMARAGGELFFDPAAEKWILDNKSSFSLQRSHGDQRLPANTADKVKALLQHYGSDTSDIVARSTF